MTNRTADRKSATGAPTAATDPVTEWHPFGELFDVGFPREPKDFVPRGALQLDCRGPALPRRCDRLTHSDIHRSVAREVVLGPKYRTRPTYRHGHDGGRGLGRGDEPISRSPTDDE